MHGRRFFNLTKQVARKAGLRRFFSIAAVLLGGLRGLRDLRELGMEGMGGIEGNFETFGKVGKSFNALRAPHTAQRATHALKFSRAEGWEKRESVEDMEKREFWEKRESVEIMEICRVVDI